MDLLKKLRAKLVYVLLDERWLIMDATASSLSHNNLCADISKK